MVFNSYLSYYVLNYVHTVFLKLNKKIFFCYHQGPIR